MTRRTADVVIVGGGAAGCVVARRLAERDDRSVLLLEAGPDPRPVAAPLRNGWVNPGGPDWPFDWGFHSEPDAAGETIPLRRGRVLGGTSWLTRFAVRGSPADFDAWAARGNPGWSFEEVLPTFRAIESDAELGGAAWHGEDGPIHITRYPERRRTEIHEAAVEALIELGFPVVEDHNAPGAVGVGPMPMSTRAGSRISTLDAYLSEDAAPSHLEIRTESPVATIELDGRRATGVRLIDGTVVGAGSVILAAGVYGSPPLLLRSGIGPATHLADLGIPVVVDLPGVGANLADHPGVDLDAGWAGGDVAAEPLNSIATFRGAGTPDGEAPDLMFWLVDPEAQDGGFYLDPVLLKPDSRGSVRLRSADPADPPRITLPGLAVEHDIERLAEGYRVGLAVAAHPALRKLAARPAPSAPKSRDELRARVIADAYSLPHVVGTCRMGPSPDGHDVVDAMGRVHGVDGLAVIDASIIPNPPSGYPHLITIMLAAHLTRHDQT